MNNKQKFQSLLKEVGAKIVVKNGISVLQFDPPLEGPKVDKKRWEKARELERLYWEMLGY